MLECKTSVNVCLKINGLQEHPVSNSIVRVQRPDEENVSLEPPNTKLPDKVLAGAEPFLIAGPMAGD
jgi:hypothetical protein